MVGTTKENPKDVARTGIGDNGNWEVRNPKSLPYFVPITVSILLAICLKEKVDLYFFNIRRDSSSRLRILVLNRQNETCNGSQVSCFHSNGIPCVCTSAHLT